MNYLLVFLGGGIGSILRYGISHWFPYNGQGIPWATFLANISACFIVGLSLIFLKDKTGFQDWQLFLITGVCGGFSTFSTFSLETVQLMQMQNYLWAGMNILLSILSCLFILFLFVKFK